MVWEDRPKSLLAPASWQQPGPSYQGGDWQVAHRVENHQRSCKPLAFSGLWGLRGLRGQPAFSCGLSSQGQPFPLCSGSSCSLCLLCPGMAGTRLSPQLMGLGLWPAGWLWALFCSRGLSGTEGPVLQTASPGLCGPRPVPGLAHLPGNTVLKSPVGLRLVGDRWT